MLEKWLMAIRAAICIFFLLKDKKMGAGKGGFSYDVKNQDSNSKTNPYFTSTGYSSWKNRKLTLDPTIHGLQDQALQQTNALYGDIGDATKRYTTLTDDLRNRFLGNEGELVNARVAPMQDEFARRQGDLQQSLGLRGLSGSSFGDQSLDSLAATAGREIGNAKALAIADVGQFENSLNSEELNNFNNAAMQRAQMTGESIEVAKARLAQELGSFNLGQKGSQSMNATDFLNWGEGGSASAYGGGGGGGPSMGGCYIAAFLYGPATHEHYLIWKHVHSAKTFKAKMARIIYRLLRPLFKALLRECDG
jgi:hypothetical protein